MPETCSLMLSFQLTLRIIRYPSSHAFTSAVLFSYKIYIFDILFMFYSCSRFLYPIQGLLTHIMLQLDYTWVPSSIFRYIALAQKVEFFMSV